MPCSDSIQNQLGSADFGVVLLAVVRRVLVRREVFPRALLRRGVVFVGSAV